MSNESGKENGFGSQAGSESSGPPGTNGDSMADVTMLNHDGESNGGSVPPSSPAMTTSLGDTPVPV